MDSAALLLSALEIEMKYAYAVLASILFAAAPAFAQAISNPPNGYGDQPSGGHMPDDMAPPTGGLMGSVTGLAYMNGPNHNGFKTPTPTNRQVARLEHYGHNFDADNPPQYIGRAAAQ
jgi:hypothetical protein